MDDVRSASRAGFFRHKAEEIRATLDTMRDPFARGIMSRLADSYDRLAALAFEAEIDTTAARRRRRRVLQ